MPAAILSKPRAHDLHPQFGCPSNVQLHCILASPALGNTLGIPVAAGMLYPFFGVLLSPVIAGAAMSLSSVSVIANALRLRRTKL